MEINIDDELRNIIPPLAEDEFKQLERNIVNEGWRPNERILVWNDFIIDGHNRYNICQKNNIDFKTLNMEFNNKDEVKLWMIDNQKGRRNLTDGWKFELAQHKKKLLEAKHEQDRVAARVSIVDTPEPVSGKTQRALAEELGWSAGKVAQADIVWRKEDLKEKVKSGEKTIHEAYSDIKKEQRMEKIAKQREELQKEVLEKPTGLYDVIVIDPPWRYDGDKYKGQENDLPAYSAEGFRGSAPYITMSLEEIKNIKLPIKEDCVLWLWTTNLFLPDCYPLLKEWGFELKSMITWDKEHFGTGRWLRSQTEHCILAIKGKPYFNNKNWSTLIREKRTTHSTKPEIFYKMIDEICAGRKLDYFARKKREGWDVYGDEL